MKIFFRIFYFLSQVDDKKFSVSINMYFGIKWNESRMNIEVVCIMIIEQSRRAHQLRIGSNGLNINLT